MGCRRIPVSPHTIANLLVNGTMAVEPAHPVPADLEVRFVEWFSGTPPTIMVTVWSADFGPDDAESEDEPPLWAPFLFRVVGVPLTRR